MIKQYMHLWGDIVYCEKENGELIHLTKEQYELLKWIGKEDDNEKIMRNLLGNINITEKQKRIILNNIAAFRIMCNREKINSDNWVQTGEFGKYYPKCFTIEMTDCCNFRCKHCYKEAEAINSSFLPKQILNKLCKDFCGKVQAINLTGGEPLLYPNFSEVINELTEHFIVNVTTNGSLISRIPLEVIKKINNIQISLYGYDEESYDNFTGVKGQFQYVLEGLRLLTENAVEFTIAMCVDESVCRNIKKYVDLLEQYNVRKVTFSAISSAGRGRKLDGVSMEKIEEMARYVVDNSKLNTNAFLFLKNHEKENCVEGCLAGKAEFAISEKGKLLYCNVLDKNEFTIGVFDDIYDIVQNGICVENFEKKISDYVMNHDCRNHICALLEGRNR